MVHYDVLYTCLAIWQPSVVFHVGYVVFDGISSTSFVGEALEDGSRYVQTEAL